MYDYYTCDKLRLELSFREVFKFNFRKLYMCYNRQTLFATSRCNADLTICILVRDFRQGKIKQDVESYNRQMKEFDMYCVLCKFRYWEYDCSILGSLQDVLYVGACFTAI